MSNIIDSIQLSGTVYTIQGSGGGSGNPTVELTQAEYDALVESGAVQTNTYYIITDAQSPDITQYWTSAQTSSAITAAVSTKQDTLVSGTNIKTINNESLLGSGNIVIQGGGGGKAISAGTNISVTTGETADTINCTLPLRVGVGYNSIYGGDLNNNSCSSQYGFAYGDNADCGNSGSYCMAFGSDVYANANYAFITGKGNTGTNNSQAAFGQFTVNNRANSTFGDSGNTLFSVGNGTSSARHNAFEIRQNGDIYLSLNGQDVKLQDQLGGGGGKAIEAGRGISITTGETADTVSFDLPISAGSQSNSVVVNYNGNSASGWMSFAQGRYTYTNNQYESAFGNYNRSLNSSNSFGVSGNTLFAVGNGEGQSTRHNSFEIRQNGDIYIADTNDTSTTNYWEKPMIKLQDTITATAANTTALGGLSLVKLTQAEYDALVTKDNSTLYVIVN